MEKKHRIYTLKENYEFRRAYQKGTSYVSPVLVIYAFKRKQGGIRIGITCAKKIGNAVKRNRARRIIKEAFRKLQPGLRGNIEYVFVARAKTPFVKSTDIERVMRKAFLQPQVGKQVKNV